MGEVVFASVSYSWVHEEFSYPELRTAMDSVARQMITTRAERLGGVVQHVDVGHRRIPLSSDALALFNLPEVPRLEDKALVLTYATAFYTKEVA